MTSDETTRPVPRMRILFEEEHGVRDVPTRPRVPQSYVEIVDSARAHFRDALRYLLYGFVLLVISVALIVSQLIRDMNPWYRWVLTAVSFISSSTMGLYLTRSHRCIDQYAMRIDQQRQVIEYVAYLYSLPVGKGGKT